MSGRTAAALLKTGTQALAKAGNEDASFDATQLLLHLSGLDRASLLLRKNDPLPEETAKAFDKLIARRAAGEPLQYLLGKWSFYQSEFSVGPGVLIPRPETEELTDVCANRLKGQKQAVVYDLCAGSGCIGISLALACPAAEVFLFELSEAALPYLYKNIPAEVSHRVRVLRHNVFDDCPPGLPAPDLIVSNPPYVPSDEMAGLPREVLREPAMALDGGADGLDFYRRLCSYWAGLLNDDGFAAFECGEGQAEKIAAMLPEGFSAEMGTDLFGVRRFVFAPRTPWSR